MKVLRGLSMATGFFNQYEVILLYSSNYNFIFIVSFVEDSYFDERFTQGYAMNLN